MLHADIFACLVSHSQKFSVCFRIPLAGNE